MWYGSLFNNISLGFSKDGKLTQSKLAKFENARAAQLWISRLILKALSRYDFEGLPETMSPRVMKQALLFHGSMCIFEVEGAHYALPAMPDSDININGDFLKAFVYGRNGYNKQVPLIIKGYDESSLIRKGVTGNLATKNGKGVWIRENELSYPFIEVCLFFAERIADKYRTLDVVSSHLKIPYVVIAEEQIINTVKSYFEKIENNEKIIISSGVFPADKVSIQTFDHQPEMLKATTDVIEWYMNQFDELCGINSNANPDKAERLLVDEVNSNNQATQLSTDSIIDYMQDQVDLANDAFGLNIRVVKKGGNNNAVSGMDSDTRPGEMAAGRSNDSGDK